MKSVLQAEVMKIFIVSVAVVAILAVGFILGGYDIIYIEIPDYFRVLAQKDG